MPTEYDYNKECDDIDEVKAEESTFINKASCEVKDV